MVDWRTFDFAGWVERMRAFYATLPVRLEGVDLTHEAGDDAAWIRPPLTGDELTRFECDLPRAIPPALARFLCTASSGIDAVYFWEPPEEIQRHLFKIYGWHAINGGIYELCSTRAMLEQLKFVQRCAEDPDIWPEDMPGEREFRQHTLPIGAVGPDDHVALDLRDHPEDPPVHYLGHMESYTIAEHFTDFLVQWERLAYLDPSRLERFRDPESGYWRTDTELAVRLRAFVG